MLHTTGDRTYVRLTNVSSHFQTRLICYDFEMSMNHLGTAPIETTRLRLRRFTEADAPAMFRNWASDPEVTRYLTWPAHDSIAVSNQILKSWVADYANPGSYLWAIELMELGEPIGSIGVVESDEVHHRLCIGYCIGKKWWNQGVTTEALTAVIAFLFDQVGASRIEALHDVANPASGRVMQKSGMVYEGIQRKRIRDNRGRLVDVASYAIVKGDPRL